LGSGQHLRRIAQFAGRGNDVRGGYRERDVELPVLEIELAGAYVRFVIPAVDVVVHRHARIPLRDLVKGPVVPHPAGTGRRHRERPGEDEVDRIATGERTRQVDAHRRAVDDGRDGSTACAYSVERQPASEAAAGEVERRAEEDERRLVELVGDALLGADVLLDEHPQVRQCIRRSIDIVDCLAPANRVRSRIERGRDAVVNALLPVACAGTAGARAISVRRWQGERTERRAVRDRRQRLSLGSARHDERRRDCNHHESGKTRHFESGGDVVDCGFGSAVPTRCSERR
jgi:hypothetical protein